MRVSEKIKITEDLINKYSEITGDKNPIHLDDEYAKQTVFNGRIAHGMLLGGFISKLISEKYPGEGSIYLEQNLKFINPCYINDLVEVVVELIEQKKQKYFLKTTVKSENKILIEGNALILKK